MAGHRDDGTFAGNKAHHPQRRVDPISYYSQYSDAAPAHGMARPVRERHVSEWDAKTDETLDKWAPEDIQEEHTLRQERLEKGHY